MFICGLYLGCCSLLRCLILIVSVFRILEEIRAPELLLVSCHSEVANNSDEFPQDDHFEFDIDDLKDQLGNDHIMQSLNALNEKLVGLGGVASLPDS